ncbi:ATP-dependent RNA helicase DEAH11, chloroplastic [Caerostris extrusa]|uniref:ATP-dependent RNA helicase DEAH11, chloroplastic n=1 Tax=Caerostris extrusa TaxID=172846 RepID=A0AAV4SWR3_CAEEX|nr:ATP-dependent RNA helicase DEAH11, chloroplastic [Caerostris extrusa]
MKSKQSVRKGKRILIQQRCQNRPKSKISKTESVVEIKSKFEEKPLQNFNKENDSNGKGATLCICVAETGSGKSTQLTQYIWREQNVSQNGLIVCTQPREIAAVSLAKHVSSQVGCALGDIVGYQVDQDLGDILAFLTTPLETEKAMNVLIGKLDKKMAQNVKIFQLHWKLDVQEQQKIFERLPNSSRKVVFATNCAETSVTIPGIKYVVDCGMVKESQYDSITNMSIISVNFVSQSSAEQRRGCAGRTQIGKCYRLYSKINYEKMTKNLRTRNFKS